MSELNDQRSQNQRLLSELSDQRSQNQSLLSELSHLRKIISSPPSFIPTPKGIDIGSTKNIPDIVSDVSGRIYPSQESGDGARGWTKMIVEDEDEELLRLLDDE